MTGGLPSRPAPLAKVVARAAHRWAADRRTNVEATWFRPLHPDRPRGAALAPAHRRLMTRPSRHLCRACHLGKENPPAPHRCPPRHMRAGPAHRLEPVKRVNPPAPFRESAILFMKMSENTPRPATSGKQSRSTGVFCRFARLTPLPHPPKVPRRNEGVHAVDRLVLIVGKWRMGR